jgi:ABC-2 type transport system ATP-binding protein
LAIVPEGPAVHVDGLVKEYGPVRALAGVSLDVQPGEVFGLLGPNGAGKTSLLRILVTLSLPTAGSVHVFGHDVVTEATAVRSTLGYLPQQLSVDGALTARENVWLFAGLYDIPWGKRAERVREALAKLGLSDAADRLTSTFSGGMVRRLELAQALVHHPRLLALDEPTVGLDPIARGDFWERIRELRESEGTTVLVSTHYMEEAEEFADRVALLHHGRVRALDSPSRLKSTLGAGTDLEDVFRSVAGDESGTEGGWKDVRATRRTVQRVA